MDYYELVEMAGMEIAPEDYNVIHYFYMNQNRIMHVFEMAEFIKAHKKDPVGALCKDFPTVLQQMAKDATYYKDRCSSLQGFADSTKEDLDSFSDQLAHANSELMILEEKSEDLKAQLAKVTAELEACCKEKQRVETFLNAYKKYIPLDDLFYKMLVGGETDSGEVE